MTPIHRCGALLSLTLTALVPLNAQKPLDPTTPLVSPLKSAERSVSCGTTILSGKPLDPSIAKRLPAGNFTMHVERPTVCRADNLLAASRVPRGVPPSREFLNRLPTFAGPQR